MSPPSRWHAWCNVWRWSASGRLGDVFSNPLFGGSWLATDRSPHPKTVQNGKVLGRYGITFFQGTPWIMRHCQCLLQGTRKVTKQGRKTARVKVRGAGCRCRWGDKGLENIACFTCMLWRRLPFFFLGGGQNSSISPDCDYVQELLWPQDIWYQLLQVGHRTWSCALVLRFLMYHNFS